MINYEPWAKTPSRVFIATLRDRVMSDEGTGHIMSMREWFGSFSLDAITDITLGRRPGFLEIGSDVGGAIAQDCKMMDSWLYVKGRRSYRFGRRELMIATSHACPF
jgi:hypothetical protein